MSTSQVGRRQFLIASSAAVVTAAVAPKLFGESAVPAKRLAMGFAPAEGAAAVMAAASIPASDRAFLDRDARVSLSGVSGGPANPRARRAVEFLVHYSYAAGDERREVPYYAWATNRTSRSQGAPVNFTVPVDETQKLSITVGVEHGERQPGAAVSRRGLAAEAPLSNAALPFALALRRGEGIHLTRGYYVIVPLLPGDSEPRWSRYHLEQADGRWALHGRDGKPANFEHFVLRIDYAKA